MKQFSQRGALTGSMWWIMCATWIVSQQAADVERFSGTGAGGSAVPASCYLSGLRSDSLRLLIF